MTTKSSCKSFRIRSVCAENEREITLNLELLKETCLLTCALRGGGAPFKYSVCNSNHTDNTLEDKYSFVLFLLFLCGHKKNSDHIVDPIFLNGALESSQHPSFLS